MEREELLRNLKQVREKEKDKKYSFGQLNVFNMVSDVIDYLEYEEKPKMTNLEYLKKNVNKFKLCDDDLFCEFAFISKTGERCEESKGKYFSGGCAGCQFRNIRNALDYLLQEHKEPIKLKQWEYDLLKEFKKDWNYAERQVFWNLNKKGYFKGVIDISMKIEDILKNCEIVSDDYEGFEECI